MGNWAHEPQLTENSTVQQEHISPETQRPDARMRLSQETIAIISVGVALAGLILTNLASLATLRNDISDLRQEARLDRTTWQTESRHLREEALAQTNQLREEARADRDAFQQEILRLTRADAALSEKIARVEHSHPPQ